MNRLLANQISLPLTGNAVLCRAAIWFELFASCYWKRNGSSPPKLVVGESILRISLNKVKNTIIQRLANRLLPIFKITFPREISFDLLALPSIVRRFWSQSDVFRDPVEIVTRPIGSPKGFQHLVASVIIQYSRPARQARSDVLRSSFISRMGWRRGLS
jgi:hypothetical protein